MVLDRRSFKLGLLSGAAFLASQRMLAADPVTSRASLPPASPGEDVFSYIQRNSGTDDLKLYQRILGAANEFKEGDEIIGVAADNENSRQVARRLLANTRLGDIDKRPPFRDALYSFITLKRNSKNDATKTQGLTLGELKKWLLTRDEDSIRDIMRGLSSDVIGCVVKLMNNQELIAVGGKLFNPLPNSQIGAKGYLGARIQPNSPTDNVHDIRWQVFNGWSYAVGDVLLGTNPVSSNPESVLAVERTLQDLLITFGIADAMPHCVLSHIDVQAEVESSSPGSTALWFQSIAGCDAANATFDIDIAKMRRYASKRKGRFGLYFETGQGADFTNGHAQGFDMVLHESRKYGFARGLSEDVADAHSDFGTGDRPWVHLNDVAGFIGPEVFRTREQLVRCCLEDIVMGKLHGLCIGLDVCSTLHMDISLDDLDWCLDQIMPANPAYLMALPTKIDPMLGYLTTGFQDHVRLRDKFGFKVNDRIWNFFQELAVIGPDGRPTEHFGDPVWVYLQYCRRRGDARDEEEIRREGKSQIAEVRRRGVFVSQGFGAQSWDLEPGLRSQVDQIYSDAKKSIWAELSDEFIATIPARRQLASQSLDRNDYILHPERGEQLDTASLQTVRQLREQYASRYNVQIVVSDGLNALAISTPGQLDSFLRHLRRGLETSGFEVAPEHLVVTSGRVRAGYRIGENLFADLAGHRAVLHVIGERPGTGHNTFSIYITAPTGATWGTVGKVDHNITKVVSGVATTALPPVQGADETLRILKSMI